MPISIFRTRLWKRWLRQPGDPDCRRHDGLRARLAAIDSSDMIALLTGRVAFKAPTQLTLDVQGVGYEVFIPLSTYYALPDLQDNVTLSIHTHVREDAIQLFGFLTAAEKESFLLLTAVSGIGPKLALSVLSTLPVPDLMSSIQAGDIEKLATVPGIGKKSAARIALELKEKASRFQSFSEGGDHGSLRCRWESVYWRMLFQRSSILDIGARRERDPQAHAE